jgi:hypothetical protein
MSEVSGTCDPRCKKEDGQRKKKVETECETPSRQRHLLLHGAALC